MHPITVPISDIKRIVTGSEYSETVVQQIGMKLSKKSSSHLFLKQGFSVEFKDQSEPLTLAADDEDVVLQWIDGLNLLLGFEHLNEKEINRLLDLEVRIRLLNVLNPPTNSPQIPELPKTFEWIPDKYHKSPQRMLNDAY
uniref:PH domain-containing protein n=1 Tax=Panagrolaimus davidi TaxID=227884 RepID=A0A914QZX8_9BILA